MRQTEATAAVETSVEARAATLVVPLDGSPEAAAALPVARALAAGDAHSCAALSDGRLRCWGANESGQLGDGTTTTPSIAVLVNPSGN